METAPGATSGMGELPRRQGVPQPAGNPRQPIYPTYPPYPPQQGQPMPPGYPAYPAYPGYPPQPAQTYTRAPVAKRATPAAPRMAKAQAQALAGRVKKWTLGLSLAGFLTLGGLVATHNVVSANAQSSGNVDDGHSAINSDDDDDGSGTQSGSYFGGQGGSGFGSGNSSLPVSGSRSS